MSTNSPQISETDRRIFLAIANTRKVNPSGSTPQTPVSRFSERFNSSRTAPAPAPIMEEPTMPPVHSTFTARVRQQLNGHGWHAPEPPQRASAQPPWKHAAYTHFPTADRPQFMNTPMPTVDNNMPPAMVTIEDNEEERHEKQVVLIELRKFDKERLSKYFTMDDSLFSMKIELDKQREVAQVSTSVAGMRQGLAMFLGLIEVGNRHFGPFLAIDGWASQATADMSKYDSALEMIYRKYIGKKAEPNPIQELVVGIVMSLVMAHAMNKGLAGFLGGGSGGGAPADPGSNIQPDPVPTSNPPAFAHPASMATGPDPRAAAVPREMFETPSATRPTLRPPSRRGTSEDADRRAIIEQQAAVANAQAATTAAAQAATKVAAQAAARADNNNLVRITPAQVQNMLKHLPPRPNLPQIPENNADVNYEEEEEGENIPFETGSDAEGDRLSTIESVDLNNLEMGLGDDAMSVNLN